jgi:uncharacterized protein YdeI (YjbR/CyaY-like superfamily)
MTTHPPGEEHDGLPIIAFATPDDFEQWLQANHATAPGFWLKRAKKANPAPSVSYEESVEIALCFGWIDGKAYRYDELWSLIRYTPRRARSVWSQINVDRVAKLEAAGRMRPEGAAAVAAAKADGRWDAAYAGAATAEVPADLQAALDENPAAAEFFAILTGNSRYAVIFRVTTAVRPETRARRISKFIDMLNRGEKIY